LLAGCGRKRNDVTIDHNLSSKGEKGDKNYQLNSGEGEGRTIPYDQEKGPPHSGEKENGLEVLFLFTKERGEKGKVTL